jgi:hypothetical protein
MSFRRREAGSFGNLMGPMWILADWEAPFKRGLGKGFDSYPTSPDMDKAFHSPKRRVKRHIDDADDNFPESVVDERVNRFHRKPHHHEKDSEHNFRISIPFSTLSLSCRLDYFTPTRRIGSPSNSTSFRTLYLGHGVVLPINPTRLKICTNGTKYEGVVVAKDEVLCRWFEMKDYVQGSETCLNDLVDAAPLGEGLKCLVRMNLDDNVNVKLLVE